MTTPTKSSAKRLRKDDTPASAKIWADVDKAASRAQIKNPSLGFYAGEARASTDGHGHRMLTIKFGLAGVQHGERVKVSVHYEPTGLCDSTGEPLTPDEYNR